MVDREARRKYAELVRQFISGRITNDEYEERFDAIRCDSDDFAIGEVYHQVWFLYDDMKTHRMTGTHRLDWEGRRATARIVLFLQSDTEYLWPKDGWFGEARMLLIFAAGISTVFLLGLFPNNPLLIVSMAVLVGVLLFTYYTVRMIREGLRWKAHGNTDVWPFLHQKDLDEAVRHPKLLNGGQRETRR